MKHTFEYKGKQKTVDIPDEWLKSQKQVLKISTREAIELWLCDNDYMVNEEQEALNMKAKVAGAGVKADRKPRKAPERKPDEVKRALIQELFACISGYNGVKNAEVTNIERVIAFSLGDDNYEITLSKKRKPKV